MYYFTFVIPTNTDGSRVSYSPTWHGTMPKSVKNVVVDLYNDKEGWGLAHTTDTFIPIEVIPTTQNTEILSSAKDENGVYFGTKINQLWDKTYEDAVRKGKMKVG